MHLFIPLNSHDLVADLRDGKLCVKIKTLENWPILYVRKTNLFYIIPSALTGSVKPHDLSLSKSAKRIKIWTEKP